MGETDRTLHTTLDAVQYPDPDDLVDEVLRRLHRHGSLVITDPTFGTFPGFLIWWRSGVFFVRGSGQRHLGTFASIEAAIRAGRTTIRDDETGDDDVDALA